MPSVAPRTGFAQKRLYELLNDRRATILEVGLAYREILRSAGRADWSEINKAVLDRYTPEEYVRIQRIGASEPPYI